VWSNNFAGGLCICNNVCCGTLQLTDDTQNRIGYDNFSFVTGNLDRVAKIARNRQKIRLALF
jgi:hypothetical protein